MNVLSKNESYDSIADDYDEQWSGYLQHTHSMLLQYFNSEDDHHILDVSAGTGLLARHIVNHDIPHHGLYLNDISEPMLEEARRHLEAYPKVGFTRTPSDFLTYTSSNFDSVICLNAFHNYRRKEQFVREMYRVIKPGGRLYILDWNAKGWFIPVNMVISTLSEEFIESWSADEVQSVFESYGFNTMQKIEWRYAYWRLFLTVFQKKRLG